MNSYSQTPGKAPFHGIVMSYGLGLLVTLFVALLYNFLIVLIPFIYLNFLLAFFFGVVIGYASKIVAKLGLMRNQQQRFWLTLTLGLAALYFEWAAHILSLWESLETSFNLTYFLSLLISPMAIIEGIIEINQVGAWSVFGVQVNGIVLSIIWLIEASLIVGVPVYIIRQHPLSPFSESLDKWYVKYELKDFFEFIGASNNLQNNLATKGGKAILDLGRGWGNRHSIVNIFYLEKENEQYLSVDNVSYNEGGKNKTMDNVIPLFKIDNETAGVLMKHFGAKKVFFFDY